MQVGKYSKDNWHVHGRVEKDCDGLADQARLISIGIIVAILIKTTKGIVGLVPKNGKINAAV